MGGEIEKTHDPAEDRKLMLMWLEQQKQETKINQQKLEIEAKENERSHEYALKALDAQSDIYRNSAQILNASSLRTYKFWGFIAVLIVGFSVCCLFTSNTELVKDILKLIMGVIGGSGAGYYFGAKNAKEEEYSEPE